MLAAKENECPIPMWRKLSTDAPIVSHTLIIFFCLKQKQNLGKLSFRFKSRVECHKHKLDYTCSWLQSLLRQ